MDVCLEIGRRLNLQRYLFLIVALCCATSTVTVAACPFCSAPTLTLGERYAGADVVLITERVGSAKPTRDRPGHTKFKVVRTVRDTVEERWSTGNVVTVETWFNGRTGDRELLLGTTAQTPFWWVPIRINDALLAYIEGAPARQDTMGAERLAYFLRFLESPERAIANDAYAEFANAGYDDIVQIAPEIPREKVRSWLSDDLTPANRSGLYGLLLGLNGNDDDARFLEARIIQQPAEERQGMDGIMAGYLLLRGEAGLALIERTKFLNMRAPVGETFAAFQAVRFLWTYAKGRFKPERLQAALHLLLDNPQVSELVIADLARWKDWSILDGLLERYGTGEFETPRGKMAIVKFLFAAVDDASPNGAGMLPAHVKQAAEALEELRTRDPAIFKKVQQNRAEPK